MILGLDLGPSSVGWALISGDSILRSGCRILPMDAGELSKYENGKLQSPASVRTGHRGMRRRYERKKLRRERLLRVLNVLGFLPGHFRSQIDFAAHPGSFIPGCFPLLPYRKGTDGKPEFVFKASFDEMLADFARIHPDVMAGGRKIPHDWTLYYLRKKALSAPVSRGELAWILLNANAKRGYYQLGEDAGENKSESREYRKAVVVSVERLNEDKKHEGQYFFEITYDGGLKQVRRCISCPWSVGDTVDIIVTRPLDGNGRPKKDKDGNEEYKISSPGKDDWGLKMEKTQDAIVKSGQTVGQYIYEHLLANPDVRIRGGVVETIERRLYRDELTRILESQRRFIPELRDAGMLERCVGELYRNNKARANELMHKGIVSLIVDDVIYYQRPLKSKKGSIADCPYESYHYVDRKTGSEVSEPLKVMPKSSPLFQEFRLWQYARNIRVFENEKEVGGRLQLDYEVTDKYIGTPEELGGLYDRLALKKEFGEADVLRFLGLNRKKFHWNYDSKKSFPALETHSLFSKKIEAANAGRELTAEEEQKLWHILYSVGDKDEMGKALRKFARRCGFDPEAFAAQFEKVPDMRKDFASYSARAVRRLLPLMRAGSHWSADAIDAMTRKRIENMLVGVADETIDTRLREMFADKKSLDDFQGLRLSEACYLVYGRHSEASDYTAWRSPHDIDEYLEEDFYKNSMRNPVVEMVVAEALRVVRDIWAKYGRPAEIHVEMGRDLKLPGKERAEMTRRIAERQKFNEEVRLRLQEFQADGEAENVRPRSPIQLLKYKLWLAQGKISPYTGSPVPLARLFTTDYEIDHIIPQKRYFDDSFNNKVVCESCVNKDKGARLAYEYILAEGGKELLWSDGKTVKVLSKEQYEQMAQSSFASAELKTKRKNLMLADVPASFNSAQLNNTRYIARKTAEILSHVVRSACDDPNAISKHIVMTNGSITDRLKEDWGLKQIWNEMMAPRFERMNEITGTHDYGGFASKDGKSYFQIEVPADIRADFSTKRIDHRHHAMDAIVIACTTLSHINYINNQSGQGKSRADLRNVLCERKYTSDADYSYRFRKPWETFAQDSRSALREIVVSFKQNLHIVRQTSNRFWHYVDGKRRLDKQTRGEHLSVRKPLHAETYSGLVRLPEYRDERIEVAMEHPQWIVDRRVRVGLKKVIALYKGTATKDAIKKYFKDRGYKLDGVDVRKVKVRYIPDVGTKSAHRVVLSAKFSAKQLEAVTDSGIRKILRNHLARYGGKFDEAFSPEGIAAMNANIRELNGGKDHKPIYSVRISEDCAMKFPVGESGSKAAAMVEAQKGTNLFFAIYRDADGVRSFETIPLRDAVERRKQHLPIAPETNEKGDRLLFVLSPGDLVYVPEDGENVRLPLNPARIYKTVSFANAVCYFVPQSMASVIRKKTELESLDKSERTIGGIQIKKVCLKLKTDRLGNITGILGND